MADERTFDYIPIFEAGIVIPPGLETASIKNEAVTAAKVAKGSLTSTQIKVEGIKQVSLKNPYGKKPNY